MILFPSGFFICLAVFDSLLWSMMRLLRSITYRSTMKLSHSNSQPTKIGSCESTQVLQILNPFFLQTRESNETPFYATSLRSLGCDLKDSKNTLWQVALLSCWPPRVAVTCQSWEAFKCPTPIAHCEWQVSRDRRHIEDQTSEGAKYT